MKSGLVLNWEGLFIFLFNRHAAVNPIAANMLNVIAKLEATKLEWSVIRPGIFLDYYVKDLPSYVKQSGIIVDLVNHFAALPGTGETPVPMTWTFDIGKYVAALVGTSDTWERYYYIRGDTPSYGKVVAAAEKGLGVKFAVSYDSVETLRKGEMTDMPAFEGLAAAFGGGEQGMTFVKKLMASNALWIEEGDADYPGPFLNEMFPEIKPVTLEEAWSRVA
ncbi:hypothetical protein DM02DRAFT_614969 [Periconia macrospinosa]|uniref:NAD(P)-binding protein n=1 Tax=Periconia macrospinosa TaxID=97972 RepID=A0A2V1DMV6_9PLEO|nr:hypothetical protein DM02DRAFT_614969 [Periconia macrospinosa]